MAHPALFRQTVASLAAVFALLTALGCSDDPETTSSPASAASSGSGGGGEGGAGGSGGGGEPEVPWTLHRVPPTSTDPAIDDWLDDHYAGYDEKVATNGKLYVHLPGSEGKPKDSIYVLTTATAAGYRVIGLMYPNSGTISGHCSGDPDVDCWENVRLEIIDGMDRSPKVSISAANSITNRLTKLLEHLSAQYPAEGWGAFLMNGEPVYSSIALSGHSQGGGHAALIGKTRELARVVMFSSVTDGENGNPAKWVNANHATALTFYYGLAHTKDSAFNPITGNWVALGMGAFGVPVDADTITPPYANSHQLTTSKPPQSGDPGAHGSTSVDADTPLTPEGDPELAEAWKYLVGQ